MGNACLCCLPGRVTHYGMLIHHRAFLDSFVKQAGEDTARWRTRVRVFTRQGGACASTQQDGASRWTTDRMDECLEARVRIDAAVQQCSSQCSRWMAHKMQSSQECFEACVRTQQRWRTPEAQCDNKGPCTPCNTSHDLDLLCPRRTQPLSMRYCPVQCRLQGPRTPARVIS